MSESDQQLKLPARVCCESTFSQLVQEAAGWLPQRYGPALMLMLVWSIIHRYKVLWRLLNFRWA